MMNPVPATSTTATTLAQRQPIIPFHQAQFSYAEIAAGVGCSRWTVGRWVRVGKREGPTRLEPRSPRPHGLHPLTPPVRVQTRIRASREKHPGWGARLIHRQRQVDRVTPLPAERTAKPLGFPARATTPHQPRWQVVNLRP